MKTYTCIKDLQGADYMVGETMTAQGWKDWALNQRKEVADDDALIRPIKETPPNKIVSFISDIYGLKIIETRTTPLNLDEAKHIALVDYNFGVSTAIERLTELGFDTSYYWQTMDAYWDDVDKDNMNLKTRDELYKRLEISEIMKRAYNLIWR